MRTYLDHAATTPVRPEVAAQVAADLAGAAGPAADSGIPADAAASATAAARARADLATRPTPHLAANPAAQHASGRAATGLLAQARADIAAALDADPHEVLLTCGGTEADALAVTGRVLAARAAGVAEPVVIISALEHPAVADSAQAATRLGAEVLTVPVTAEGTTRPADVAAAVEDAGPGRVAVVALMAASNETGAVQDVAGAVAAVRTLSPTARPGQSGWVAVHTDAVAAISASGCQAVSFRGLGVDSLAVSGHKLGAPVGTGALVLRRETTLVTPTGGGRQERGIRSGTQDVIGARALALALRLAGEERAAEAARLESLRTVLLAGATALPGVRATLPDDAPHLPGTAHLWVEAADGEALLMALDLAGIDASAGSACHAGVAQPSAAMLTMGFGEAEARASLRLTMGRTTTRADVDRFLAALPAAVEAARRSWTVRAR